MHCVIDLEYMTLIQGHDTPSGHGRQLREILSGSNLAVKSYDLDTDGTRDMTLSKGHETPLFKDNNV